MTFYTSYFARSCNHPNALSISCSVPKWYNGRQNKLVAPSWELVNGIKSGTITREEYTKTYLAKLNRLGIDKVISTLQDGDVLLCWEASGDFCHRHILAEWLRQYGHTVTEIGG